MSAVSMLPPPEIRLNPYPMYEMMRRSAPVVYNEDWQVWLVFRHDDVKAVLSDHRRFSSQFGDLPGSPPAGPAAAPELSSSLITTDPPRHTRLRGLVASAFSPRAVAALEPRIRAITHALLDQVAAAGRMDLIADLAIPLPVQVIAEMLGVPPADRDQFKRWSDDIVAAADAFVGGEAGEARAHRQSVQELYDYFGGAIARRRAAPRDDLISGLLAAELDGERLTEDEILGFCWLLLVAGNETTTNLIGNAVWSLLEHPGELARLRADPGLVPAAVEETLRYRSPAQAMFRVARADVALGGQTIRAGDRVVAFIGSANRDPERFPEPDRFDAGRDPNPHIAFGHGSHFCLGAPLARLEGRVALAALLERLPDLGRADAAPLEPVRGFIVHGVARLPLRFTPGRPAAG